MIHYGLATPEQAKAVFAWLDGERIVANDTSQGEDIYRWRFGPRSSTKRNLTWYFWGWSNPEALQFGDQVQDGGAVLGFSYFDLMSRLKILGPDNSWQRLQEILAWFEDVKQAGGYRAYYSVEGRGSLQGGGKPGGLGMDQEFFESILVPQVVLYGYLGFRPTPEGFAVDPCLPSDWPSLSIDRIRLHNLILSIKTTGDKIEVHREGKPLHPYTVELPAGKWKLTLSDQDGRVLRTLETGDKDSHNKIRFEWGEAKTLKINKK